MPTNIYRRFVDMDTDFVDVVRHFFIGSAIDVETISTSFPRRQVNERCSACRSAHGIFSSCHPNQNVRCDLMSEKLLESFLSPPKKFRVSILQKLTQNDPKLVLNIFTMVIGQKMYSFHKNNKIKQNEGISADNYIKIC